MPSETDQAKNKTVFISYAHADKAVARDIFDRLQQLGLTPYLDEIDLHPSENIRIELEKKLNSSDLYLLLWSENANREWVIWELTQALQRAIYSPLRLLTVRIDFSELPELIRHNLAIDLQPSYRLGLARILAYINNDVSEIIPVEAKDQLFRPNMSNLTWYLKRSNGSSSRAWRIVIGDDGILNLIAKIFEAPPSVTPELIRFSGPVDYIRTDLTTEIDQMFLLAECIATAIVQELTSSNIEASIAQTLSIETCRRYLSWAFVRGFVRILESLTWGELDTIDITLRKRFETVLSLARQMNEKGLSYGHSQSDPVDLLFGIEIPLDRTKFEKVDLAINKIHHSAAATNYVSLYVPKSWIGCSDWVSKLCRSKWPPESYILDENAWTLVFLPQIARYITLMHSNPSINSPTDPSEFTFLANRDSYDYIGRH